MSFAPALVMVWVGVLVPEPQVGVESFLELVVPRVLVRIDLVQVFAQLFAVADDGWSLGSPGKLACSYTKTQTSLILMWSRDIPSCL